MSASRTVANGGFTEPAGDGVYIPAHWDNGYVIPASAVRDYGSKVIELLKKQDGDG